jgi:hypothetical protein
MQQRVETLPAVSGVKLAIGIGFHYGPAQEENNDVSGDTVNIAQRLVKQAKIGQIVTSGTAIAALPAALRLATRALDLPPIKTKDEDIGIFEALWIRLEHPQTIPTDLPPASSARLCLTHGGREVQLDATHPLITLGRESHCDLVIKDQRASRNHCRIEMRRSNFVLRDMSTNGTFVSPQDGAEFHVKNGEATLKGCGRLCFGQPYSEGIADFVDYEVC